MRCLLSKVMIDPHTRPDPLGRVASDPFVIALAAADAVVVTAFLGFGLFSHGLEPWEYPVYTLRTAVPFVIAWGSSPRYWARTVAEHSSPSDGRSPWSGPRGSPSRCSAAGSARRRTSPAGPRPSSCWSTPLSGSDRPSVAARGVAAAAAGDGNRYAATVASDREKYCPFGLESAGHLLQPLTAASRAADRGRSELVRRHGYPAAASIDYEMSSCALRAGSRRPSRR